MKTIKFIVYGEAVPKGRAKLRVNKKLGTVHMYTPDTTRQWEESVLGQSLQCKPDTLITSAIIIGMKFYRSIPKSMSKKKRILALQDKLRPAKKPDLDNYIKSTTDALKGIYWVDDNQIVEYLPGTGKYYSDSPRVELEVQYDFEG